MITPAEFAAWAPRYGLEASDLGRGVTLVGVAWRVVGLLAPHLSRRFPVLLASADEPGHIQGFDARVVRAALARVRALEAEQQRAPKRRGGGR